jgi:integrase/recombinase XerD
VRLGDRLRVARAGPGATQQRADSVSPTLAGYRATLVARTEDGHAAPLTAAAVNLQLAALRAFLTFLADAGAVSRSHELIRRTLAGLPSRVTRPYEVLSAAEMVRLLASVATRPRDHALLMLMLGSGLRAAEVCRLKVGDLVTDDDGDLAVYVRQGKGRKDRTVPLAPAVAATLRGWLAASGKSPARLRDRDAYLFPGRNGALTTQRLWQIVTEACGAAGIDTKAISPHALRHTYALTALRRGAGVKHVRDLLGHASVATTERYLDHLERADLKRHAVDPTAA